MTAGSSHVVIFPRKILASVGPSKRSVSRPGDGEQLSWLAFPLQPDVSQLNSMMLRSGSMI